MSTDKYAVPFNPSESQAILKLSDGQWLHWRKPRGRSITNFLERRITVFNRANKPPCGLRAQAVFCHAAKSTRNQRSCRKSIHVSMKNQRWVNKL